MSIQSPTVTSRPSPGIGGSSPVSGNVMSSMIIFTFIGSGALTICSVTSVVTSCIEPSDILKRITRKLCVGSSCFFRKSADRP